MVTQNSLMSMKDTVPDVDTAVEAWNAYMKLCGKDGILNETDYQKIWVKEKDENGNYITVEREFKKKSAWQKLARAFNVDTCIVDKEFLRTKTGRINEAYYCVRATLPNGRTVESDAICNRREKGKDKIKDHDIMAIAKTRATNRAIAELIGAGEVSSEEITPAPKPPEIEHKPEPSMIETKTIKEDKAEKKPIIKEAPQVETVESVEREVVEVFQTADEIGEPDPLDDPVRNQCQQIKVMLEREGRVVNKVSMKMKVFQLIEDEVIPAENEDVLIDFIVKHCPEDLD